MSEKTKYESYLKKLEGLCDEHDLTYRLRLHESPISLTVRPVQGLYEQMSMLEKDEGVLSPDAYLRFEMKDGELNTYIGGTFVISDALFTKLRSLFRNLEYRWLQFFFRDIVERGLMEKARLPVIEVDEEQDAPELDAMEDIANEPDWEEQIRMATAIVRAENSAELDLLRTRLGIPQDEADAVLAELEDRGIINDSGEVLPLDEPDDPDEPEEPDEEP